MRFLLYIFLAFASLTAAGNTSAIIESWDTKYRVARDGQLNVTETIRIRVLDERGYDHAILQNYHNTFVKINRIQYTIYDVNNKRIKRFNKADALDVMVNPSYEIDDTRVLLLDPKYRIYPFIVEIEQEVTHRGYISFPPWIPRRDTGVEVQSATLTLECSPEFKFRGRELNGVEKPHEFLNADGYRAVKWTLKSLPALQNVRDNQAVLEEQPKVLITPLKFSLDNYEGEFRTWATFGDWYLALNKDRNTLSPSTKAFLDGLKATQAGDIPTMVKTVYQYMQSKTRYISIQLGIGGYRSIPADVVERTGYGDCKALTNYMKSMLDYLGVPSNCVLVRAGSDAADILSDFPSNQFNHIFLAVPRSTDTLWFECTNQMLPPGYIGMFTDDRHVLWMEEGKSSVVKTPIYSETQSLMKREGVVELAENGDALLVLKVRQQGMFFDDAMYFQNLPKDRTLAHNLKKFSWKDFSISSFDYAVTNPNEPSLDLRYALNIRGLGKRVAEKLVLPVNLLTPIDHDLNADPVRRKCTIRRAYTIDDKIQVRLPENYRVQFQTEQFAENFEFCDFHMSVKNEDGLLTIRRKVVMKKGVYEKERFDEFYDAIKKIKTIEQAKLVIVSRT